MFPFMICLLSIVSAQTTLSNINTPVYSRIYLRGLKRVEDERIQALWINRGIRYIVDNVIAAAKQGFVQYTTETWEGCELVTAGDSIIDREGCEIVVNGIKTFVSNYFPDSEVIYDCKTKRYTLKWD